MTHDIDPAAAQRADRAYDDLVVLVQHGPGSTAPQATRPPPTGSSSG